MQYPIPQKKEIHIDILLAVAEIGGVETVINRLGGYLQEHGYSVRVVQLIYEGFSWVDSGLAFTYCYETRKNQDLEKLYDGYLSKLKESADMPDIILATAWPYMSYIAKRAVAELSLDAMVVSYLHGPLERYESAGYGGAEALLCADVHFAISQEILLGLRKADPTGVMYRVNNPLPKDFAIRSNQGTKSPMHLAYIGRLSEEKNVDLIIRAVSESAYSFTLSIVGSGPKEDALKQTVKELGLNERVIFLGWQDNPWEAVDEAGFLVMASFYEGFSLTLTEALAKGKGVISTAVPGATEIIEENINGYLFPIGDKKALVACLDRIGSGQASPLDEETCKKTVEPFSYERALFDIKTKLTACVYKRILPTKDFNDVKISVIIPVYNCADTLARCLDSIFAQSIGPFALEVIVVNDASTDTSPDILMAYERRFPEQLLVIHCEENRKQGAARNIGLSYASGDYILFVDADDAIAPPMIEELYTNAFLYQTDICECEWQSFTGESAPVIALSDNEGAAALVLVESKEDRKNLFMQNAILTAVWRRLYKKDFLLKHNLFFPEEIYMEDIYFSQLAMARCESLLHIDSPYYFYYQNEHGTMRSDKMTEYYMDIFYTSRGVLERLLEEDDKIEDIYPGLEWAFGLRMMDMYRYITKNVVPFPKENWQHIQQFIQAVFPNMEENEQFSEEQKKMLQEILSE